MLNHKRLIAAILGMVLMVGSGASPAYAFSLRSRITSLGTAGPRVNAPPRTYTRVAPRDSGWGTGCRAVVLFTGGLLIAVATGAAAGAISNLQHAGDTSILLPASYINQATTGALIGAAAFTVPVAMKLGAQAAWKRMVK